jgi:hypothetical protein
VNFATKNSLLLLFGIPKNHDEILERAGSVDGGGVVLFSLGSMPLSVGLTII